MNLNDNQLEHINVRPLSEAERSQTWARISSQLATTPAVSPFVFPFRTLSLVATFLIIVGTVRVADNARPGQLLFPVDLAVERVESSITPSSRSSHARERVDEFEQLVALAPVDTVQTEATPTQETRIAEPQADTAMFSLTAEAPMAKNFAVLEKTLPPETETLIEDTRKQLNALLLEALNKNDSETASNIQSSIDEFEAYIVELRKP